VQLLLFTKRPPTAGRRGCNAQPLVLVTTSANPAASRSSSATRSGRAPRGNRRRVPRPRPRIVQRCDDSVLRAVPGDAARGFQFVRAARG
jgi:hypothetical protein